jgi:PAS domain S-box-containing protein
VADVRQHSSFRGFPTHHPVITSFLGVPIHDNGRSVGNLYLGNKRGASEFTHEDLRAIELLAAHAGAVVRQARMREQLGKERARFKAILEHAPQGVAFVEMDTMKVLANRRAVELLGRPLPIETPEKVEYDAGLFTLDGKPIDEENRPARRVMRGEAVQAEELIIRRPDGTEVPVLVSAAPVVERDRTEGVVLLFEDLSIFKEWQRLREEWAAIITHDLRQPVNILTMQAYLLQRMAASPDPEKLHQATAQLQKAAKNLSRMVADLGDASSIETKQLSLERQFVDLESLVRDVVENQRTLASNRRVSLNIAGPIPRVYADPLRIEQVLGNLLVNALKYSDTGTSVDVQVRILDDAVHVLVTNRGPGIPPDELPKLFDRYYRTSGAQAGSERGLGLGLYIAKGLIEAHGGRIWAESTPGEATTFRFTLPCGGH